MIKCHNTINTYTCIALHCCLATQVFKELWELAARPKHGKLLLDFWTRWQLIESFQAWEADTQDDCRILSCFEITLMRSFDVKKNVYIVYIYVYIWLVFRQVKVYRLFIRTFAPWGLTSAISSFTSGILERPRSRSQHVTWCDRFVYQDPAWNRSCLSLGGQWRHVLALSGQLGKPDAILQTKARGPATSNYCRVICSTQNELWSVIVHLLLYAGHKCHKHLNRNVLMGRKNTGCSANNLQVLSEVGKSNWPLALCLLQGWDSKKELSCHVKISCCAKKKMLATFLRSEGRKGFQLFQESTAFAPFYTLQSTARWWHCRTWECDRLCWGRSGRGQEP